MEAHRGNIVKNIIKKQGYSISKLANKLGVPRGTLHKKLAQMRLDYDFIDKIGQCIFYDFSSHFPNFKSKYRFSVQETKQVLLGRKYTNLLEKYQKLLEITIQVADKNHLQMMKNKKLLDPSIHH